ncbi:MAG: FAD-dependent oxidoreductase [Halobacteria archaeon]
MVNNDVVVVGAGPAGCQCARDAAARGYDVTVLETEGEEEFPARSNKSTGGTFPSMMSSFGIPDDVVMNFTDKVVLESPENHLVQEQSGAVLEFGEFKEYLVEDAREKGACFEFGCRASKPLTRDGKVVGVQVNGDEEVRGTVTVDASGPSAAVAKHLGLTELDRGRQAVGIEYQMDGVDLDPDGKPDLRDAMMLRLDHDYAPGGYSWIFHTGGETAKVGVCYIQNNIHSRRANQGYRIDDYLQEWIEDDERFDDASVIDDIHHRGSGHIQNPHRFSAPGFLAIGDTVPTIDPVWGEGIDKCMQSGRAAAVTVDNCLMEGDGRPTGERMKVYDEKWRGEIAPNRGKRLMMAELLYRLDNDRYDRLLRDLGQMDDTSLKNLDDGDITAFLDVIEPGDLELLGGYIKDRVRGDGRSLREDISAFL